MSHCSAREKHCVGNQARGQGCGLDDMKTKPRKAKSSVTQEFETARLLWRMTFSCETFQAVQAGIDDLLTLKLNGSDPKYYPLVVGLICLYARPFTNNFPVGPLTEEIIPEKFLVLHRLTVQMRHQIFEHADASPFIQDSYPNELVFVNNIVGNCRQEFHLQVTPFVKPSLDFFQSLSPLLSALIEKTHYHADKLGKKFFRYFGPSKNVGEFRLNVLDSSAPLFSKVAQP